MKPGYVVLKREADGHWREVREVPRRPGLTASRRRAIEEAAGAPAPDGSFAVLPLNEWRLTRDSDGA